MAVATAPACTLGVSKSSFYSFLSAKDVVYPKDGYARFWNNLMNNYLFNEYRKYKMALENNKETKSEFNPSYLPKEKLFLIEKKYPFDNLDEVFMIDTREHGDIDFYNPKQTKQAQYMNWLRANIIENGVRNSYEQKHGFVPLPPIERLIEKDGISNDKIGKNFQKMIIEGQKLKTKIVNYAMELRSKHFAVSAPSTTKKTISFFVAMIVS